MKILNLGCGYRKIINAVNVDIDKQCNPDMIININERLPFKDNEFDKVVLHHVLEHSKDMGFTLSEALRVSGSLEITIPTPISKGYYIKEHNYYFNIYGLRGKRLKIPLWLQKLIGIFIPSEWVIEVRKR